MIPYSLFLEQIPKHSANCIIVTNTNTVLINQGEFIYPRKYLIAFDT